MGWVQVHIQSDPEQAELLEELLLEAGSDAVSMADAEDQPLYEPELGTTPLWNHTRVTGLFDENVDMDAIMQQLVCDYTAQSGQPLGEFQVEAVEDKPWERAWMDDFKPMLFGRRLWICPTWIEPPRPDDVNLMLDPGLAFGTGTHPTTALCLAWLDGAQVQDKQVIDYGCGSGVLGLAALLLGARHVMGVDTDPQALEASRQNAQRNQVPDEHLSLHFPELAPELAADILLANILAQPLLALAPHLAHRVKPAGQIVLSGLLSEQANELLTRYSEWFDMDAPCEQDGWVRLSGVRHDRQAA